MTKIYNYAQISEGNLELDYGISKTRQEKKIISLNGIMIHGVDSITTITREDWIVLELNNQVGEILASTLIHMDMFIDFDSIRGIYDIIKIDDAQARIVEQLAHADMLKELRRTLAKNAGVRLVNSEFENGSFVSAVIECLDGKRLTI